MGNVGEGLESAAETVSSAVLKPVGEFVDHDLVNPISDTMDTFKNDMGKLGHQIHDKWGPAIESAVKEAGVIASNVAPYIVPFAPKIAGALRSFDQIQRKAREIGHGEWKRLSKQFLSRAQTKLQKLVGLARDQGTRQRIIEKQKELLDEYRKHEQKFRQEQSEYIDKHSPQNQSSTAYSGAAPGAPPSKTPGSITRLSNIHKASTPSSQPGVGTSNVQPATTKSPTV